MQNNYKLENSKLTAISVNSKPNKNLIQFFSNLNKNSKILDYGAGKGRHSNFLRNLGFSVYSYDPYNGNDNVDGFEDISSKLPENQFDVVFTAFVLNTTDEKTTLNIISSCESLLNKNGTSVHIVREDLRKLNGGSILTKKGTFQRDIKIKEFVDLGYKRKNKLFIKKIS